MPAVSGSPVDGSGGPAVRVWGILVVALVVGTGLRVAVRLSGGLLEDEIIAVLHAVRPLLLIPPDTLRYDVHPPLYFMQLHVWGLVSRADWWFVLNSQAWGIAGLVSLWLSRRRLDGGAVAMLAVAVMAVMPTGLWMAQEVRPYAFMAVLMIWLQHHEERLGAGAAGRGPALVLLGLGLIYSHAVGFLFVLFAGLHALWLLLRRRAAGGELRFWLLIHGALAVAALPVLANSLLRDANIGNVESVPAAWIWLARVVATRDARGFAEPTAALVFVVATSCGLLVRGTRARTACLIVAPLLLAGMAVAAGRPIFKSNVFGTLMLPALCVVAATLLSRLRGRVGAAAVVGTLAVLSAVSGNFVLHPPRGHDFEGAARAIEAGMRPGDVVYVPQETMLGGMAWYLSRSRTPVPDDVGAPASLPWRRIYDRLGPRLVAALHWEKGAHSFTVESGLTFVVGEAGVGLAESARRVWLVTYPHYPLPEGYPPATLGRLHGAGARDFGRLQMTLYQDSPESGQR